VSITIAMLFRKLNKSKEYHKHGKSKGIKFSEVVSYKKYMAIYPVTKEKSKPDSSKETFCTDGKTNQSLMKFLLK
jgi:hypothetical protein